MSKGSITKVRPFQPRLREELDRHGWTIHRAESFENDWWFLETWELRSVRSPTDFTLFLTFEFDDLFYTVAVSLEEPTNHQTTNWKARLYLRRGWEREISEFLAELDILRSRN